LSIDTHPSLHACRAPAAPPKPRKKSRGRGGKRARARTEAALQHEALGPGADDTAADVGAEVNPSCGRELWREFYARQKLLSGADEWRAFGRAMRTALPVTFRRSALQSRRAESEACWCEGLALVERLEAAGTARGVALEWCGGYQLGVSRTELRGSPLAEAAALQRWLVASCDAGLVVRQELVSMLPAAMLRIQPNDAVLDMCAAPGSKTAQLLEAVDHSAGGGVVVANDTSPSRAYVLAHRIKGLAKGSPLNVLVVSHRGQRFPRGGGDAQPGVGPYDKVLCDVPCSGDGTLRKEPSLWSNWRPGLGQALHSLQLQLATRAASLLKVRHGPRPFSPPPTYVLNRYSWDASTRTMCSA